MLGNLVREASFHGLVEDDGFATDKQRSRRSDRVPRTLGSVVADE
jgi:hypothetical protein